MFLKTPIYKTRYGRKFLKFQYLALIIFGASAPIYKTRSPPSPRPLILPSMIQKRILRPERLRRVPSSFSWLDHRLMGDGILIRLQPTEMLLYFFLVLVSDREGLSFYSLKSIARHLKLSPELLQKARQSLCHRSLLAYQEPLYQVLSLPLLPEPVPPQPPRPRRQGAEFESVGEVLKRLSFLKHLKETQHEDRNLG